jgi:hypothetical protein
VLYKPGHTLVRGILHRSRNSTCSTDSTARSCISHANEQTRSILWDENLSLFSVCCWCTSRSAAKHVLSAQNCGILFRSESHAGFLPCSHSSTHLSSLSAILRFAIEQSSNRGSLSNKKSLTAFASFQYTPINARCRIQMRITCVASNTRNCDTVRACSYTNCSAQKVSRNSAASKKSGTNAIRCKRTTPHNVVSVRC